MGLVKVFRIPVRVKKPTGVRRLPKDNISLNKRGIKTMSFQQKTIKAGALAKLPPIAVKLKGAIAATNP
jgi:hypothetical protein